MSQNPSRPPGPLPIRGARQAQGKSLRATALEARIDVGRLSRVERGMQQPTVSELKRLADVLGLKDLSRFLAPYVVRERRGQAA